MSQAERAVRQALKSEAAHFRSQLSSSSCESTPPRAPEINDASPTAEMSHVSRPANPILSPEASLLLMAKARKTMRQQCPRRQREQAACCQHAASPLNADNMLLVL